MSFSLVPVTGSLLIDREDELKQILTELSKPKSKIGFSLTGKRRVGKTSILFEVKERLGKTKIVVIYISVWKTVPDTLDTFLSNLFDETMSAFHDKLSIQLKMFELMKMGKDTILKIIKSLKFSVDMGEDLSYSVSFAKGEETNFSKATIGTFNLIDKLAQKTNTKCVLIIDEFPSIQELKVGKKMVDQAIVKTIRSINETYKKTALVISGSFRHTMQSVVLSADAPLYRQLVNMEIQPLDKNAVKDFIKKYMKKTANQQTIKYLLEISSGLPYNLQILGREIDYLKIKTLDKKAIQQAVNSVIKREGDLHFKEHLNIMQSTEIKVVKTMATTKAKTPSEIVEKASMALNKVTALLSGLVDKGIIIKIERGKYEFSDNMFKIWLEKL